MPHRPDNQPMPPHAPGGGEARITLAPRQPRPGQRQHQGDETARPWIEAAPREIRARIAEIGRGGIWLRGELDGLPAGLSVRVALPGATAPVPARLVLHTENGAAFAFHQDAASRALIEHALQARAGGRAVA